ncbi:hypothetical protein MmiHf6_18050 [Methanimicrococcus hongohii]|uniref:Uncharacterized protein n=1 Tax=Methanimicrococcus hongohii TaxID=3028295 RepID=A0AA96V316_9EURY|nr:hypothetical protein [Methanimicrococcus sp. Hf6]WNY24465.1 hypothetical protein MmiHf6_18050 [Methanimicrococcus sp. Hf6]
MCIFDYLFEKQMYIFDYLFEKQMCIFDNFFEKQSGSRAGGISVGGNVSGKAATETVGNSGNANLKVAAARSRMRTDYD